MNSGMKNICENLVFEQEYLNYHIEHIHQIHTVCKEHSCIFSSFYKITFPSNIC